MLNKRGLPKSGRKNKGRQVVSRKIYSKYNDYPYTVNEYRDENGNVVKFNWDPPMKIDIDTAEVCRCTAPRREEREELRTAYEAFG